jgi:outer membrane protein
MKRLIGLALAILLMSAVPALSEETKIAFVDLQKALNLSAAGKAAKEKIAGKVKDYETLIDSRQEELKKLKEELEKKALLLSEAARGDKERDYQQKLKEFQRYTKDVQEELQQQDADHTRRILEEIFKVIKAIGEDEKYTLVLEKTESSILYADDQIDLTDKIIKAYDARYAKGSSVK